MDHRGCSTGGISQHALAIIRIVLGVIFFMHGAQKVLGWFGGGGLAGTVQIMSGMGLSTTIIYLVSFGELLGGIGLILGLLTRLAALGILIIMAGAVVTVHWKHGFFLQNQGYEYNFALIGMCVSLILGGSGCCALDRLFCRKQEFS